MNRIKYYLKKTWTQILRWTPLTLSLVVFGFVFWTLYCKLCCNCDFYQTLSSTRTDIITISGILSGIIIAYLTSKVLQIRGEKIARLPELIELTQKVHKFRAIAYKLIHSSLWVNGLSSFINQKYQGLTFFDVREIVFVEGKVTEQATNFIRDHEFGDTANLFLELKSFLFDRYTFDDTLYSEFDVPVYYNTKILEKWIRYDCGNGLWYYFSHKYGSYSGDLKLHNVYTGYQEDIKNLCLQIDQERYKDLEFGNDLLANVGTQFHSDILPKLYRLQLYIERGLPSIVNYLFVVLCLLILFGVALPLLIKIYFLSPIFDITSIAVITSICFYIVTSFYSFLKSEIAV